MKTPFDILDVVANASDAEIKKAYLKKVRQYSPEHAPEQFQIIRKAFEAIQTERQRLKYQLFNKESPTVEDLLERGFQQGNRQRPSESLFIQALSDSLHDDKN